MSGAMAWVRDNYGVPAQRGRMVRFQGARACILSAKGGYLMIRMIATGQVFRVHPTWQMEYDDPQREPARLSSEEQA